MQGSRIIFQEERRESKEYGYLSLPGVDNGSRSGLVVFPSHTLGNVKV